MFSISVIYSTTVFSLLLLSAFFIKRKGEDNVWTYAAKIVPLSTALLAIWFPILLILTNLLAFLLSGNMYVNLTKFLGYTLLLSCFFLEFIVIFRAIRLKKYKHSWKVFMLYFVLSSLFIFGLSILGYIYDLSK